MTSRGTVERIEWAWLHKKKLDVELISDSVLPCITKLPMPFQLTFRVDPNLHPLSLEETRALVSPSQTLSEQIRFEVKDDTLYITLPSWFFHLQEHSQQNILLKLAEQVQESSAE